MFTLAEELRQTKKRVITSTTTKIWHHEAMHSPHVVFVQTVPAWRERLKEGLGTHGHAFLAESLLESGKVKGINPSLADELFQGKETDYLIVEADGAAGHPVKAPAEHEPVIPSSVTKVVGMMGLEALGRELSPEIVFRMDLFTNLTGLHEGERLTTSVLSKLFLDPGGLFKGTPVTAKRVAFLNKLELLGEDQGARELARLILGESGGQIKRVVTGSIIKGHYQIFG